MRTWPQKQVYLQGMLATVIAFCGTLIALLSTSLTPTSVVAGLLMGLAYFLLAMRRFFKRRRIVRTPFPESWRAHLQRCVPFYRKLDGEARNRFENDVRFFLAEQTIYGVDGAAVPDDVRVLVGAGAAMLGHGLPDWEWPRLRDIIIYPTAFNDDYDEGDRENILGMVHSQGPILFSARDIRHGFCVGDDGLNVGLHELAHVLDMANGRADGVPIGATWMTKAPWVEVLADRLRKMQYQQDDSVLRPYAGTNEAEFFAVAVEVFFEQPERLRVQDPQLYDMLADYFNIDPQSAKLRRPS